MPRAARRSAPRSGGGAAGRSSPAPGYRRRIAARTPRTARPAVRKRRTAAEPSARSRPADRTAAPTSPTPTVPSTVQLRSSPTLASLRLWRDLRLDGEVAGADIGAVAEVAALERAAD